MRGMRFEICDHLYPTVSLFRGARRLGLRVWSGSWDEFRRSLHRHSRNRSETASSQRFAPRRLAQVGSGRDSIFRMLASRGKSQCTELRHPPAQCTVRTCAPWLVRTRPPWMTQPRRPVAARHTQQEAAASHSPCPAPRNPAVVACGPAHGETGSCPLPVRNGRSRQRNAPQRPVTRCWRQSVPARLELLASRPAPLTATRHGRGSRSLVGPPGLHHPGEFGSSSAGTSPEFSSNPLTAIRIRVRLRASAIRCCTVCVRACVRATVASTTCYVGLATSRSN